MLKRIRLRRVLNRALMSPMSDEQRMAIETLLSHGLRNLAAFNEFAAFMDGFAASTVGADEVGKLGDGTILKMLLDNLPAIVEAILKILAAFGI